MLSLYLVYGVAIPSTACSQKLGGAQPVFMISGSEDPCKYVTASSIACFSFVTYGTFSMHLQYFRVIVMAIGDCRMQVSAWAVKYGQ